MLRYRALLSIALVSIGALGMLQCDPSDSTSEERISSADVELFEARCGACHTLEPPPLNGPPARGIAMQYRRSYADRETAISNIIAFAQNPSAESALMPHAVDRFGLMPRMQFDPEELERIAAMIWAVPDANFPAPEPAAPETADEIAFVRNCGACHRRQPPPLNGPPATAIAFHYGTAYPEQPDFERAIRAFVANPVGTPSLLPDAVDVFGHMPLMQFPDQELAAAIRYLWSAQRIE